MKRYIGLLDAGSAVAYSLFGCKSFYSGNGIKCRTVSVQHACSCDSICNLYIRMGKEVRKVIER